MGQILRVTEAFADFKHDPNGQLYPQGMLVADSDDVTSRFPSRFERVEVAAHRATETAVSAPGLRRSITRPEKPARHHGRGVKKAAASEPAAPAKKRAAKRAPAKKAAAKKTAAAPTPDEGTTSEVL